MRDKPVYKDGDSYLDYLRDVEKWVHELEPELEHVQTVKELKEQIKELLKELNGKETKTKT